MALDALYLLKLLLRSGPPVATIPQVPSLSLSLSIRSSMYNCNIIYSSRSDLIEIRYEVDQICKFHGRSSLERDTGVIIKSSIQDTLGQAQLGSDTMTDTTNLLEPAYELQTRSDPAGSSSNKGLKRPIMIHRAVLGSLERFFGVLIEHYVGDFPLWLCPIQARVLPVTDTQLEYCNQVTSKLKASGIRAEVCSGERLPKLIRNAEKQKIPLMAVVGPKEVETQTLTVRSRFGGELGTMTIDDFISRTKDVTENRTTF
ncbi:hypothetical protein ACSBR2_029098 [Camellia fascicularis]